MSSSLPRFSDMALSILSSVPTSIPPPPVTSSVPSTPTPSAGGNKSYMESMSSASTPPRSGGRWMTSYLDSVSSTSPSAESSGGGSGTTSYLESMSSPKASSPVASSSRRLPLLRLLLRVRRNPNPVFIVQAVVVATRVTWRAYHPRRTLLVVAEATREIWVLLHRLGRAASVVVVFEPRVTWTDFHPNRHGPEERVRFRRLHGQS
jgi:hypothetical protein